MLIHAPISVGELYDKITILQVKSSRLTGEAQLANVRFELEALQAIAAQHVQPSADLSALIESLHAINAQLWDIEDGKRQAERDQNFDEAFIALARSVYLKNDDRARIKRDINLLLGSKIVEEKSHARARLDSPAG